jgi:hypothetical protein
MATRGKLDGNEWAKIGKGAAIAGGGAAAVYLFQELGQYDYGEWGALVGAGLSVLINFLRKLTSDSGVVIKLNSKP